MSKISIDGHIIGTIAEEVEYNKNNAETVEDALDALFERAGSSDDDEISNSDLAMLADKLLVAGGVQSGSWKVYHYINSGKTTTLGSTFNPNSLGTTDSYRHCCFRVYAGDTLHYKNCGSPFELYGYVLTDNNYKVVALPDSLGYITGTTQVTEDGWCFALGYVHATNYAVIYADWTTRKTLANKKGVLGVIGDSISSDTGATDLRPICYPRILAKLMNCELDRRSKAGANLGMTFDYTDLVTGYMYMRSDCDYVTILMGGNDATPTQIANVPVGDVDEVMALDPDTDIETLKSTYIGRYRLLLYRLKNMMAKDVKIFCIGPYDERSDQTSVNAVLPVMRSRLSSLVTQLGGIANGYYYINGSECLPFMQDAFLDHVHPNEIGQVVLANTLYTRIKEVLGE